MRLCFALSPDFDFSGNEVFCTTLDVETLVSSQWVLWKLLINLVRLFCHSLHWVLCTEDLMRAGGISLCLGSLKNRLEKGVAVSSGSPAGLNCLLLTSLPSPNLVFVASGRELSIVHCFPTSPKEKKHLGAFVKPTNSQLLPLESLIELVWAGLLCLQQASQMLLIRKVWVTLLLVVLGYLLS